MTGFLEALGEHAFLQRALAAGFLSGLAAGIIGPLVVIRRISFLSGGIAHCLVGGVGLALLLEQPPLAGALLAGLAAGLVLGIAHLRLRQQEDVLIGALWPAGMAFAVILASRGALDGTDLMGYLFGNILLVTRGELWMMAALDLLLLGSITLFYRQLAVTVLDPDYARSRGVAVNSCYLLLMVQVVLTVVLLMQLVGITMSIALLALPAAMALGITRSLVQAMLLASVIGTTVTLLGLAVSWQPDLPAGATTVLLMVLVYLGYAGVRGLSKKPV